MSPLRHYLRYLARLAARGRAVATALARRPQPAFAPRPLKIMRLEKRRVLAADFSVVGGALMLDGFDGGEGETLSITQYADSYEFTSESGWNADGLAEVDGASIEGDTLTIARETIDSLSGGLVIGGDSNIDVTISSEPGSATSSLGETPSLATVTPGLTLTSINVAGDLTLIADGAIIDSPGTSITVSGDATFISNTPSGGGEGGIFLADTFGDSLVVGGDATFLAMDGDARYDISVGEGGVALFGELTAIGRDIGVNELDPTRLEEIDAINFDLTTAGVIDTTVGATIAVEEDASLTSTATKPAGDYTGDGIVDDLDYDLWWDEFGMAGEGLASDGNRDGVVDNADFTIWRDTEGEVAQEGGIFITMAAQYEVGGQADMFAAEGAEAFDITVAEAVDARFGSLALTGATIFVQEDDSSLLDALEAGTFTLISNGPITDADDAVLMVSGDANFVSTDPTLSADRYIRLADAGAENQLVVGGVATFVSDQTQFSDLNSLISNWIDIGVATDGSQADALFTAGSIRFANPNGAITPVRIAEDDSTLLASWNGAVIPGYLPPASLTQSNADHLEIYSSTSITDQEGAHVVVTGDAVVVAEDEIVLANLASESFEVGDLLSVVSVSSYIDLGVNGSGEASGGTFDSGRIRFSASDGFEEVRIHDLSEVVIASWDGASLPSLNGSTPTINSASLLEITTPGSITDETEAKTAVGDATFVAGSLIRLADAGDENSLMTIGNATFIVTGGDNQIDVGVAGDGSQADAFFGAGGYRFAFIQDAGSTARFAEDNATLLLGWAGASIPGLTTSAPTQSNAEQLEIYAASRIWDTPGSQVVVSDDAVLVSPGEIVLVNEANESFEVADLLSVVSTGSKIDLGVESSGEGSAGAFDSGRVRFSSAEATRINDASDVVIASWDGASLAALNGSTPTVNEAASLEIVASDMIRDDASAKIEIASDATFYASTTIQLAYVGAGKVLDVSGVTTVVVDPGGSVNLGDGLFEEGTPAPTFNSGSLRFSVVDGYIAVNEASDTVIASWSGAVVPGFVNPGTNEAIWFTLNSDGTVSDSAGAIINTGKTGITAAGSITLDEESVNFDSLFVDGTDVLILEASSTILYGVTAAQFFLVSQGDITDLDEAVIEVAGDASFRAAGDIVLANEATMDNRLVVDGLARFEVDPTQNIDVGVNADGTPADAIFVPGTLSFAAPSGVVRIATDSAAILSGANLTADLRLNADGAITDDATADTEVTTTTELVADDGAADVVLGDEAARFSLGSPELFNEAEYLAIEATNVSVQADSAVNIRTSDLDAAFAGTYYLTATGTISQVGGAGGELQPLTAERVSLTSDGAVLFSSLLLTAQDDATPNLQIKAGAPIDLLAEISSDDELNERFDADRIPSSIETDLSPIVVEADLDDGTRPDQPPRDDEGLEDVLVDGDPSRVSERAPEEGFEDPIPTGPDMPIDIGDAYAIVVRVEGDAVVGDVEDATGTVADPDDARGLVVTTTANAFLDTTGALTFSGEGRYDESPEVVAALMSGGVLTAVAGTTLRIDTEEPDQPGATARTTVLRSATGSVTSIAPAEESGDDGQPGPRLIVDPSTEEGSAATTGLVRADTDFEQRITMAVGSRGEDNLLIEIEWADVAEVREQSVALPSVRPSFEQSEVAGSRQYADLIQTPVDAIEATDATQANTGLIYQELEGEFRVVTVTHNYEQSFVPQNPAQDSLPTTVRVYNDPAINLFDQGGERDLNSASFTIAPRIITLPPAGFFLITQPDLPTSFETVEVSLSRNESTTPQERSITSEQRTVVATDVESVEYGRVDESGEWLRDIPGEPWPLVREDAEGDFLREIRQQIDEGGYSEGRYRILIRTPRGEQLLEEWIKGDLEGDGEAIDPEHNDLDAPVEEAVEPAIVPQAAALPTAAPAAESTPPTSALAAMAAVGSWRRRLGERGAFEVGEENVLYTRISRRRRRRF